MQNKLKIVFTNDLDIGILDKDFYKAMFRKICGLIGVLR